MNLLLSLLFIFYSINISSQFLESFFPENSYYNEVKSEEPVIDPGKYWKCLNKTLIDSGFERCKAAIISYWGVEYPGHNTPQNNISYCCSLYDWIGCQYKYAPYICTDQDVTYGTHYFKSLESYIEKSFCDRIPYLSEICYNRKLP